MTHLRDYQRAAIDSLYTYWQREKGNPLIVAPCGAGKSIMIAQFIREAMEYPDTRILVLTHRMELLEQDEAELRALWPGAPTGFYSSGLGRKDRQAPILFAGIQSVHSRLHTFDPFDLVLIDECFTGDTLVSTPSGERRIDQVSCGDIVYNLTGTGVIESKSARPYYETYTVELSNDRTIECTGNHPFFTSRGWIKAASLEVGEGLYGIQDMRWLWERISSLGEVQRGRNNQELHTREGVEQARVLLSEVCKEAQPHCSFGAGSKSNQRYDKEAQASAYQAWRKRAVATFASTSAVACSWAGMGGGASDKDRGRAQERGVSKLLQGGHRERGEDDCNRNRRRMSHERKEKREGCQERRDSNVVRVVSVSRNKRKSARTVYNLRVSGHPSYFANGVAVHNCHLIPRTKSTMYGRAMETLNLMNPQTRYVGFTATPFRLDSGLLHEGEGSLFDRITYEVPVRDLIDRGELCEVIGKRGAQVADLEGVKKRGGEFVGKDVERAMDVPALTRAACQEIVAYGHDRRAWLIFASGVKHAEHVRLALEALGIDCAVVHGGIDKTTRADRIEQFKSGRLRCLINVDILTIGFNAPICDMGVLLRATASTALYVQIVGRLMRTYPGKHNALLLDYGGNVERHGPIDKVRPKRPSKGDGDAPAKPCPNCYSIVGAGALECPDCGYQFPEREPKHERTAFAGAVMSHQDEPQWVTVDSVSYHHHQKQGKPDSVRVEYQCGLRVYRDWWLPEHKGMPRTATIKKLWKLGARCPETTDELLAMAPDLPQPDQILIRPEGKYERVESVYCGSEEKTDARQASMA